MTWIQLLALSILVEAIIETLKPLWDPAARVNLKDRLITLGLAVTITVMAGIDIFTLSDLPILAWAGVPPMVSLIVGAVLTGIIVSRGANWIHDLVKRILGIVVPKP